MLTPPRYGCATRTVTLRLRVFAKGQAFDHEAITFRNRKKATAFGAYVKTGSGREFARRQF